MDLFYDEESNTSNGDLWDDLEMQLGHTVTQDAECTCDPDNKLGLRGRFNDLYDHARISAINAMGAYALTDTQLAMFETIFTDGWAGSIDDLVATVKAATF